MQFKAKVKSDPARSLKGVFQCTIDDSGLRLEQKKKLVMTLPRGTASQHHGGNLLAIQLPDRWVTLALMKFPAYQARLTVAVSSYLRGERPAPREGEMKLETYLLIPAALPFGIMILTRGGAIWGALGGGVAFGCLALAQAESLPRPARLGLILLINVVLYGLIALLVMVSPQ